MESPRRIDRWEAFTLWHQRKSAPATETPVRLPDQDHEDAIDDQLTGFEVEGQTFIIEYTDAQGLESVRRITVSRVFYGAGGIPTLGATCHERRAYRMFRCDRISSCIDLDGEIHGPRRFLLETLGVDITKRAAAAEIDHGKLIQMRRITRPDAVILAALSRSDGYMHPAERTVAALHCETVCQTLEPTIEECEELEKRYKRLYPTPEVLAEAIGTACTFQPERTRRLLLAGVNLVHADGIIRPEESAMLNDLSIELLGFEVI